MKSINEKQCLEGYESVSLADGRYFLIPYEEEEKTEGGIIIPSSSTAYDKASEQLTKRASNEGIVVARGAGWTQKDFKPGTRVLFIEQLARRQYIPSLKKEVLVIQEPHIDGALS